MNSFLNIIDLDEKVIPFRLISHIHNHLWAKNRVFVRKSSSGNWHFMIQSDRCPVCETFCDEMYVDFRDTGKPFVLWEEKSEKKRVGPWVLLEPTRILAVPLENYYLEELN